MDQIDLEKLRSDIDDLQRAVRRSNPLLRSIMHFRSYALLAIPYGIAILAYCLGLHFLAASEGSPTTVPEAWKTAAWIGLAAITILGLFGKFVIVNKKIAELKEGANFLTATKALYEGNWTHIIAMVLVFMIAASIYAASIDRAWYIETILAIGFALVCGNYGAWLERREILVMGWYLLLAGLSSLFFIESAPFLWSAILWAGAFFAYGIWGLVFIKPEKEA
jgi:hypothetical protein